MSGWKYILVVLLVGATGLHAQEYGARLGTVKRGGKVSFEPQGPGVLFDALDPAIRKWYVPQELYAEYGWKQWEYANYARQNYQRYVSTSLEGNYFYDVYGNFLTRGWLIFDWRQQNPQPFGSSLSKDGRFRGWFSNLLIASDHKGQYHYAITIGDQIRTTLTPLTFSKPLFNGVQWDFLSDKYAATLLLSRISDTQGSETSNNTSLLGGRLEIQVGDFVKVGGTFVNAHHAQTQTEVFNGNILKGNLTGVQNLGNVTFVEILIEDDSPEDGEAGGALFASDILIRDLDGKETRGSEIGFRPLVEGGFQRQGFLAADGSETIRLRYDFQSRSYTGPDPGEIESVRLELVVANDYRIEMASDRQIDFQGREIFLEVARAPGNVKDSSNQRVLAFDYGLPTANQVAGVTLELTDLESFNGYLEVDVNRRYQQYPNPNLEKHSIGSDRAEAWMLNLSHASYPHFAFLEAFSVEPGYTTALQVVDQNGVVDYGSDFRRYEFVDDNDDQDRYPDWARSGWSNRDPEVFPGWDENSDFVSDFNQNDSPTSPNRVPDYEEPFLRFHTDRPEFLYGVDMNHNGWIDRFENDEEADYPYRRDRRGYNLYLGTHLHPDLRVTAGRQRVEQIADDRRSRAWYLMLAGDHGRPWGRMRLFQDLRKVKDDIADDLLQWVQPPNSRGELQPVDDGLPARDAVVNTTWLGLDCATVPGLKITNKFKWQLYHRLESRRQRTLLGVRRSSSFLGLIDKVEYRFQLGRLTFISGWKSEFRSEAPVERRQPQRRELSQILLGIARWPVFLSSYLEAGVEYHRFAQLREPTPPGAEDSFRETTLVAQLTNASDYQGYQLTTVLGFDATRRRSAVEGTRTRTRGFLTVYAGVER